MTGAVGLRTDFDGSALRGLARGSKDGGQTRRLLALAEIYDGGTRSDAARIGGVRLQSIRDWVLRFNAKGPEGLIDGKAPGPSPSSTMPSAWRSKRSWSRGRPPHQARHRRPLHTPAARRYCKALARRKARPSQAPVKLNRAPHQRLPAALAGCLRTSMPWRLLKKLLHRTGDDPHARRGGCEDRNLVPGRSRDRPEEQVHPALGQARHTPHCPAQPTHQMDLHLRRHLSAARRGHRPGPALVQHRGDEPPSGRDRRCRRTRRPCRARHGPGRLAHHGKATVARQHHHPALALKGTGIEPR